MEEVLTKILKNRNILFLLDETGISLLPEGKNKPNIGTYFDRKVPF